jgi:hypothetical protein
MSRNFFHPREPYARLRRAFIYKDKPSQTPATSPAAKPIRRGSRYGAIEVRPLMVPPGRA